MGITDVGKQQILEWLIGNSPGFPTHIGVGSGTTGFNATQTALVTEAFPDGADRNLKDAATRAGKQATIEMLVKATDLNGTADPDGITEAGLFDSATSGNMFSRNVFNSVPKDDDTEITVIENIRFV